MPTSFFQYEMLPTTWFYLSTLIILAMFFKFSRFWSVRNLDLVVLVLFTPGLLMLAMRDDPWGYVWLFGAGLLMVIRMVFDTAMTRRPLLEPNLSPGGVTFSCLFLVLFIIASLTVNRDERIDTIRTLRLEQILTTRHIEKGIGMRPDTLTISHAALSNLQPGFLPFLAFAERTNLALAPPLEIQNALLTAAKQREVQESIPVAEPGLSPSSPAPTSFGDSALGNSEVIVAQPAVIPVTPQPTEMATADVDTPARQPDFALLFLMLCSAIGGHIAIVFAFLYIGHCHFGNIRTGIACATLYMLLPYTNQMVGRLDHLIPAALILWAVALYRRPFFSGLGIGVAGALVFYPIFLIPLWCSFYWRRGWIRFLVGNVSACIIFAALLFVSPGSLGHFREQLLHMLGRSSFWVFISQTDGFWTNYDNMVLRVPVMAAFFALCFSLILWPARKHLAMLLSGSALLMLSVQFWQLHQGGLFMAWYLPLLILTIFRPNLEDRVAQSSVAA